MKKLLQSHVVVVFGATSRIGKATIEALAATQTGVTIVAAVEQPKDPRVKRLRRATGCHPVRCRFTDVAAIRRVVHNADAVLLVPALSPSGITFSKHVADACAAEDVQRLVLVSSVLAAVDNDVDAQLGYASIETHARRVTDRSITLRTPMLMDTLLYCRDEVVFANRFFSSFQPTTAVPCIAVHDVARAAAAVLSAPMTRKFHAVYSLASATTTCSANELAKLLSQALGRPIIPKFVDDDKLVSVMMEKGASELVATNTVRYRQLVETPEKRRLLALGQDYLTLAGRPMTTPFEWLESKKEFFERSDENQMQLFVMGAGEGLFQEVERLIAQQVTAPSVGESVSALVPTSHESASTPALHSKVTFCTIKTVPGGRQRQHAVHTSGHPVASSPMAQLLDQLTPADVVLFVPPLRFGDTECLEALQLVVAAAKRANAWGIVVVSSLFAGHGFTDSLNHLAELEQFIEKSGVPYVIVRLPLLMEYLLALAPTATLPELASTADEEKDDEGTGTETEVEPEPPLLATPSTATPSTTEWPLLGKALASTPQYWISTADAAKVLVSVAYTFPLHRNHIRSVVTDRLTMNEVEGVLQRHAYKGARIDFSRVDALYETAGHEFWRVAYWPQHHVKQLLEAAVQLSGSPPLPGDTFEDMTACPPMTMDKWAARHAKSFTRALAMDHRRRKASTKPHAEPQPKPLGVIQEQAATSQ